MNDIYYTYSYLRYLYLQICIYMYVYVYIQYMYACTFIYISVYICISNICTYVYEYLNMIHQGIEMVNVCESYCMLTYKRLVQIVRANMTKSPTTYTFLLHTPYNYTYILTQMWSPVTLTSF